MNIKNWSLNVENDWTYRPFGYSHVEWLQVRHIKTPDDFAVTVRLFGLGLTLVRWTPDEWEAA